MSTSITDKTKSFLQELMESNGFKFERSYGHNLPVGWRGIVSDLLPKLRDLEVKRILQIKEKFGGLRVYVVYPEGINGAKAAELISEAEEASFKTCTTCSKPVAEREGWFTLCESCEEIETRK